MASTKFIFLVSSLLFLSFSVKEERYIQTEYGPAIEWTPATRLEWSDFKASSKTTPSAAVATSTCGFVLETKSINGFTNFSISVRFYCEESWHDPKVKTPEVLAHEQLHFDICEIYGRKLCKELLLQKKSGKLNAKKTEFIYNKMLDAYNKYQDLYDRETNHSRNKDKQEEWSLRVKKELEELQPYEGYRFF